MKTIPTILVCTTLLSLSCFDVIDEQGTVTKKGGWRFLDDTWSWSDGTLRYKGGTNNTVAWYDQKLSGDLSVELRFKGTPKRDNERYQMVFIVFGNGQLYGDTIWKDGAVVVYKIDTPTESDPDGRESVVKHGGMSQAEYLDGGTDPSPPAFAVAETHTVSLTVRDDSLSVSINGTPLHRNLPMPSGDTTGYFGVANYFNYDNDFELSDVSIEDGSG
jgi:hypothetical protein